MQKPPVHRLTLFQSSVLCLASLAVLPFGIVAYYSAVLGALLVILPQAYFSWRVFRFRGAQFSQSVLKSFYVGETVKLLMTFSGFALIFSTIHPLKASVMMLMFIVGQLLFWFTPLLLKVKKSAASSSTTVMEAR